MGLVRRERFHSAIGKIDLLREKITPVILREYISYNCAEPIVFVVNKPVAGWDNTADLANKFIGLVSYADIPELHNNQILDELPAKGYNYNVIAYNLYNYSVIDM